MKPPIRLIAVDLDGTLLNSRKRISVEDREALRAAAARGVEIVPVTGRSFTAALPLVADLLTNGPLIASNGALIRSKAGETFLRALLPVRTARLVLDATRPFRPYTVLMYDQDGASQFRIEAPGRRGDRAPDPPSDATCQEGPASGATAPEGLASNGARGAAASPPDGVAHAAWIERYSEFVRFSSSLEEALDGDPLEVLFAGPLARLRELLPLLADGGGNGRLRGAVEGTSEKDPGAPPPFRLLRTEYPERDFCVMNVIRWDCSKGHALEYWSRWREIGREEILAIGDNYNDLEMLRFAGLPVVMANAEEPLKQEGWPVTADCDSSGVARAIEQYVL